MSLSFTDIERLFRHLIVEKTTFSSWLCNQASLLSIPASSGTQSPSSTHSFFFFLPDRPTHHHKRRGDGKRNILLGWPKKTDVTYAVAKRTSVNIQDCRDSNPDLSKPTESWLFKLVCKCTKDWWRWTWRKINTLALHFVVYGWL